MTPERIRRHDDERLYQPRIHSKRIRELYLISEKTGDAMTVLVDRALAEFIERQSAHGDQGEANLAAENVVIAPIVGANSSPTS